MSKFKPGDRVRCIGDSGKTRVGDLVTVRGVSTAAPGFSCVENTCGLGCNSNDRGHDNHSVCFFELVESKMEKQPYKGFKRGDKVVANCDYGSQLTKGQMYTFDTFLGDAISASDTLVRVEESNGSFCAYRLDPAPAETSIEILIKKANEGFDAVDALIKLGDVARFVGKNPGNYGQSGFTLEHLRNLIPHLKAGERLTAFSAKPKMEPFKLTKSGYWVELCDGGTTVKVGCQAFSMETLRKSLRDLTKNGKRDVLNGADLMPTRGGIYHGKDFVTWEDADQLLANLEKIK